MLALLFALSLAAPAPASHDSLSITRVADGVYVFSANNTAKDWVDGNSTAIVTSEGVVVVDAPSIPLSRIHLDRIRALTDAPVRYLVNTHWHSDHLLGNQVYKDAFPDLQIIAQAHSKRISDRRNPGIIAKYAGTGGDAYVESLERQVTTRKDDDGRPLTAYEYRRAVESLDDAREQFAYFDSLRYTPPTMTFEKEMTMVLGGREMRIMHFQGHTRGDAVVYLPAERILIAGDLVIHPVPYGINSYFEEWIDTLGTLMALDARVIVPGHGAVQYSNDYLGVLRDLLTSLVAQARDAVRQGLTLDELNERIDLEAFRKRLVGDNPELDWAFQNYFMTPAVGRAYQEAKGEL